MKVSIKRNVIAWTILLLLAPSCLWAKGEQNTVTGFDYLLDLSRSKQTTIDPVRINGILDYVARKAGDTEPDCRGGLCRTPMAYYGIDVNVGLDKVLKYCFNPEIPSCAVLPSLIRLSVWHPIKGSADPLPDLWKNLDTLKSPIVVPGVYYMQNTPDPNSGAYYGYESNRTLILMKYKGRNTLISVLKQNDVSEVGKKGYALSEKDGPKYFYSGEKGLNKLGLGWVKSYLYDSFSVAVYMEHANGDPGIRFSVFKWIRAGWAGNNMVRQKHVRNGLIRFGKIFKEMMESDDLPSTETLAHLCHIYKQIPSKELKIKMAGYLEELRGKYSDDCSKMLGKHFDQDSYINHMTPLEMRATLIVDAILHLNAKDRKTGDIAFRPGSDNNTFF